MHLRESGFEVQCVPEERCIIEDGFQIVNCYSTFDLNCCNVLCITSRQI